MQAMVLKGISSFRDNKTPLELVDLPEPVPGEREILVKVSACGVCHTELDEIEGRTPPPAFPIVLGHQVVGRVTGIGRKATKFRIGDRGSASAGYFLPAAVAVHVSKGMRMSVRISGQRAGMSMEDMPGS